ncbi:MAG: acyltransferase family protein [Burkholderiaceae bacterium]
MNRLNQLDGLRGVAALLVLLYHFTTRYDEIFAFSQPLPFGVPHGGLGVSLFFAISGYVIFMTLENIRSARDFVVSRFSRLFPVFWVCVILTWLLWRVVQWPGTPTGGRDLLFSLTMLPEQFNAQAVSSVYWSLREELLFYLWMLLLWQLGLLKRPVLWIGLWLAATAAFVVLYRLGIHAPPFPVVQALILKHIAWFMLGVLVYVHQQGRINSVTFALLALLAITCALLRFGPYTGWPAGICAVLTLTAVYLAVRGKLAIAGTRVLMFFGAISYPLYLIHEPFGWVVIHTLDGLGVNHWVSIAAATAAATALAYVLHKAVEMPAMRWLRGKWRRNEPAAASSTPAPTQRAAVPAACLAAVAAVALAPNLFAAPAYRQERSAEQTLQSIAPQNVQPCAANAQMIVVLGQSNAGSHAPASNASPPQAGQVFWRGQCAHLQDPLPGTTGGGASVWAALVQAMPADAQSRTVIAPLAVGNTRIANWVLPGTLYYELLAHLNAVRASGIAVRAVLWQQGEADMWAGTEARYYLRDLKQLRAMLDAHGITAPLYTATSTYCKQFGTGNVRRALARVHAHGLIERVLPGPDTDALTGPLRADDCHFSEPGRQQAAALWLEVLSRAKAQ